jgi:hypothetical protein
MFLMQAGGFGLVGLAGLLAATHFILPFLPD